MLRDHGLGNWGISRMHFAGVGRVLFAVGMAALGAFTLGFPGFGPAWPATLHWLPWHDGLARLAAVILVAGGLALLVPRSARPASLVLAIYLLLRLLLVALRHVVEQPQIEVNWEEMGENMVELAGAWAIFSMMSGGAFARFGSARGAQILFGLALLPIGLSHFFYLGHTAELIPLWLPFHVPLSEFTGAAHFAAGAAIVAGVLAPLAATLEAVMVSLFTLLVWVPMVIARPSLADNWSEICVSTAISGAAWAVAESLRNSRGSSRAEG